MAKLNFPDPTSTQTFTDAGITWTWNDKYKVWSSEAGSADSDGDFYAGAAAWGDAVGQLANGPCQFSGLNVASVTRTAAGIYSVIFTTPMPNADYSAVASITENDVNGNNYSIRVKNKRADGFDVVIFTAGKDSIADSLAHDGQFSFAVHATNALPPKGGTGADAWATVEEDGTTSGSFNLSSALSGTDYNFTFTTPMPSAEYAVVATANIGGADRIVTAQNRTTTGFTLNVRNGNNDIKTDAKISVVVHATNAQLPDTVTQEQIDAVLNSGPLAGLRNLIINPFAQINQRGDQASFTDQRYCADRWRWAGNGSTISVYSLSPIALGAASDGLIDLTGQDYRQRVEVNSGANDVSFDQRIEGVNTLIPGQQYTESIYVRSTTAQSLTLGYRYRFGTGSTTPQQQYGGPTIDVPANTWTRISHTFTAADRPATQDLKEDNATDIFVTGIQGFCEFSGWQLEPGPAATPVEQRPVGMEMNLCERYYVRQDKMRIVGYQVAGQEIAHSVKCSMRANPAATTSNFSLDNVANGAQPIPTNFESTGGSLRIIAGGAGTVSAIDGVLALDAEL